MSDDIPKIRGFRIDPSEIEARLLEHTAVRAAAVVAREGAPGERWLVAYVVLGDQDSVSPPELRAHLRTRFPDFMVPSAFVAMDALPLTSNGLVDREALPQLYELGASPGVHPRSGFHGVPSTRLRVSTEVPAWVDPDEAADALAGLVRALSALHIEFGGNGLEVDGIEVSITESAYA